MLIAKVVDFENKPIENVIAKIIRLEKEPISPQQWVENLRNRAPFKRFILSKDIDKKGTVKVELTGGICEAKAPEYSLGKIFELTQNKEILFIKPKKKWWQ